MKQKPNLTELRLAIEEHRPALLRAFGFSIFTGLVSLAPTIYMFEVYGRVVDSRSHLTLFWLTFIVVFVYVVLEVIEWTRLEVMRHAGTKLDRTLSTRVFDALFAATRWQGRSIGTQPFNDLKTLRDFFFSPAVMAVLESPVSIVFLILLYWASPMLGHAALVGAIVQVILGILNDRRTQPNLLAANRLAIGAQQYADSSIRNAQVIQAMGMLKGIHARWMKLQRDFLTKQAIASERAGGFQSTTKLLQMLMSSGLMGLGAYLLLNNELAGGAGMMIVASVLGGKVVAPMAQLISQWRTVINAKDAYMRLDQLLAAQPAQERGMRLPAPVGRLSVEHIVAGAPGTNMPIIRGVNFSLAPGEVLAVIGPSAAGKSSLARYLVGVWPTLSGKVRLDGSDVFVWDKTELGPHIGYLPQGVELFEGTIAENISRFGAIDFEKVQHAARLLGLHDFIVSLPQGYDTQVGPDGQSLSGGQRQRVAIARALYGNPRFVVLDEPNSSLDEAGDQVLAQAIEAMKVQGTTFVVITHRTSILAVVDKLLVLRDGAQAGFGARDEVLTALKAATQPSKVTHG